MMIQEAFLGKVMKYQIKTNYHTHTYLCKHAEGTPSDHVNLAKSKGYVEIAITDHGPLIDEIYNRIHTRRMNFEQYKDIYLPELEKAKKIDGITVFTGLEIEFFDEMSFNYSEFLKDLDLLVLGQHYYHYQDIIFSVYDIKDYGGMLAYADQLIKGIKSGFFKFVAHPDIYCWNYPIWDDNCIAIAKKIIQASIDQNMPLEINANGIRNSKRKNHVSSASDGHVSYSYPKYEFWKLAKEMNATVIINDDTHWFNTLQDEHTIEAYELAHELKLTIKDRL